MKPRTLIASLALLVLAGAVLLFQQQSNLKSRSIKAPAEKISPLPTSKPRPKPRPSPEISLITDTGLHWEERIAAVRALPTRLGEASVDFLFAYLSAPHDENEENRYLVCNEIMEIFRKRSLSPHLYNRQLCHLIATPGVDPVIRDYAAQHLAQWISGISPEATEPDPTQIPRAFETMLHEAAHPANAQLTLSGTIFQAMADAILNGSEEMKSHRPALIEKAMQVLADPTFSTTNRSSAMQAAAQLNAPELREKSLDLAQNPQNPADLRLSAIAALGKVGNPSDKALLNLLSEDPAYYYAATAALQNLTNRPVSQ
jgi:hypothetical protein